MGQRGLNIKPTHLIQMSHREYDDSSPCILGMKVLSDIYMIVLPRPVKCIWTFRINGTECINGIEWKKLSESQVDVEFLNNLLPGGDFKTWIKGYLYNQRDPFFKNYFYVLLVTTWSCYNSQCSSAAAYGCWCSLEHWFMLQSTASQ